jgi:hypothetical protein
VLRYSFGYEVKPMPETELLVREVRSLPSDCVKEALELITALKQKRRDKQPASSLPDLGAYLTANSPRTIEEALQIAEAKAADPNRKPLSRFFGKLPGAFGGDGVAYQKKMRDEWD